MSQHTNEPTNNWPAHHASPRHPHARRDLSSLPRISASDTGSHASAHHAANKSVPVASVTSLDDGFRDGVVSEVVHAEKFDTVSSQGFVADGGMGTHHNNSPYQKRPKKRMSGKKRALIAGVAVVVVGALGGFAWFHRPVSVEFNGARKTITINTTVGSIVSDEGITEKPGNYVDVAGEVLQEGKGDAYSVTVDGKQLSFEDGEAYKIHGGEAITIGAGADKMEPYTTETVETQPKLKMEGNWGAVAYISQWGKVDKRERRTGKESGKTADGEVIQQGQDCIVTVKNVEPANGQKLVALTFDDGPSQYTEQYLKILKDHGAVATFFNLAQNVDEMPDLSKAIVDAGCQLASHTYSHQQLTAVSADTVYDEVTKAFSSIEKATGVKTTCIRPPYGDFRQKTWLETKGTMSVSAIWNMDSEDWRRPGVDKIVSNSINGIVPGYIILMHDGGGERSQDVEALPKIIDQLHEQGYTFVTLTDLLKSDPSIPSDIANCNATMPQDAVWPTELG